MKNTFMLTGELEVAMNNIEKFTENIANNKEQILVRKYDYFILVTAAMAHVESAAAAEKLINTYMKHQSEDTQKEFLAYLESVFSLMDEESDNLS